MGTCPSSEFLFAILTLIQDSRYVLPFKSYISFFHMLGIQTDSVLSAKLHISKIYIIDVGRLVIEFKTQTKFRGMFYIKF